MTRAIATTMNQIASRLEAATEKMWDAAEGLISGTDLAFESAKLVGYADLCSEEDRAAYLALARQMQDLANSMRAE